MCEGFLDYKSHLLSYCDVHFPWEDGPLLLCTSIAKCAGGDWFFHHLGSVSFVQRVRAACWENNMHLSHCVIKSLHHAAWINSLSVRCPPKIQCRYAYRFRIELQQPVTNVVIVLELTNSCEFRRSKRFLCRWIQLSQNRYLITRLGRLHTQKYRARKIHHSSGFESLGSYKGWKVCSLFRLS